MRLKSSVSLWGVPLLTAAAALVLAVISHAHHYHGIPRLARGTAAGLVLFLVCGDGVARLCAPGEWRRVHWLLAPAVGAPVSGLVLMAFGVAHVPLSVSLWLTLALGLAFSVWVRRRGLGRASGVDWGRGVVWSWGAVLAVVFCVMIIPAGRLDFDTVYGQNPDAVQVVGIANLFQHVPPTGTDNALPLDKVPPAWRFRYPIFYPLAAASNLSHYDPIRVFPAMAALLAVFVAFGCGLLAVEMLGLSPRAGPAVSAAVGFSWVLEYLVWHPYWNQLWGLLLCVLSLLFGLAALMRLDARLGVLCVVCLLGLWFAYPLALPYAIVLLAALVVAYWRRPTLSRPRSWRGWAAVVVGLGLLIPAIAGSALKLGQGISQLLSPHSNLWGGDIFSFLPFGHFVGVGGGLIVGLAVLAVAAGGLLGVRGSDGDGSGISVRARLLLALALAALVLLDLRFRLVKSGTYMDFKHLSFVGTIVLTLAAGGIVRAVASRRPALLAAGGALVLAWLIPALVLDRADAVSQGEQVTDQLFQLRAWAAQLPPRASISINIPRAAGGVQLWATYMVGTHPLNVVQPVIQSTYAVPVKGARADYSLSLRYQPNPNPSIKTPFPKAIGAVDPPVRQNTEFSLRRIVWPAELDWIPANASTVLSEP